MKPSVTAATRPSAAPIASSSEHRSPPRAPQPGKGLNSSAAESEMLAECQQMPADASVRHDVDGQIRRHRSQSPCILPLSSM